MSRPENPLNFFRTYSYHHILIACDGTETAEALANSGKLSLFDRGGAAERIEVQSLDGSDGGYVVLINGMSDAQFTITSAKWSSVLIPSEAPSGETQYQTMAVDGELTIQEIGGVRFLNSVAESCDALEVDPNGLCFMLKTLFVGHRDDGTTEMITNIRPLLFFAYDIAAEFDITGAEYIFSFVGMVNGAGRLPLSSSVGDGFSFSIQPGWNLDTTMKELEGSINSRMGAYREKLKRQSVCEGVEIDWESDFKEVTYKIVLDNEYKEMKAGTNSLPQQQTQGNKDPTIVQEGDSISMEGLISLVMRSSQQVIDETDREKSKDGKEHTFKITSAFDTGPDSFVVVYHVQQYESITTPLKQGENPFTFDPGDQGIEFDYIFTGQNVDIVDFDIKMQMGMAFFQTLTTSNTVPSSREIQSVGGAKETRTYTANEVNNLNTGKKRPKKPLFHGMTLRHPSFRNYRASGETIGYSGLLARFAQFEQIETRMTIRGNPQLLNDSTLLPSSIDPNNNQTSPTVEVPGFPDSRPIMPQMHKIPGYVKVNIKMPLKFLGDQDKASSFEAAIGDPYVPFWYQGWYYVYAINNVFAGGEFTQELEMMSIPTNTDNQNKLKSNCKEGSTQGTSSGGTGGTTDQQKKTVQQLDDERDTKTNTREE